MASIPNIPGAKGLVPVELFEEVPRSQPLGLTQLGARPPTAARGPGHDSGYSESYAPSAAAAMQRNSKPATGAGAVYGAVMFDFQALREDELEAKAGEYIVIAAQSNSEWFVAKPIARLGGPGLIPVSYVEIRELATGRPIPNPAEVIKANVPPVEEWKKRAAEYKSSSIPLGKFEAGSHQNFEQHMERMSLQNPAERHSAQNGSHGYSRSVQGGAQQHYPGDYSGDLYAPEQATVSRYCYAEGKYWFVISARLGGRWWELSRYYEDFYDFQRALFARFPSKRILPEVPREVDSALNEDLTKDSQEMLNTFVKNLLMQPREILEGLCVRQFFAPREGDYEKDSGIISDEPRDARGARPGQGVDDPSRHYSRDHLNGAGYSGHSTTPRQVSDPYQGTWCNAQLNGLQKHSADGCFVEGGTHQPIQGGAMKVKMYFEGDLIALRVPTDVQYEQLCSRIRERTKRGRDGELQLFYKDERTGNKLNLMSDDDLSRALRDNEKLLLYAEVV
jgi:bud emergence protein 1